MGRGNKRFLAALCAGALVFLTACGGGGETADLEDVLSSIGEQTDLSAMYRLSEKRVMDRYGIQVADMEQAILMVHEESLRADELWLIRAPDEETARELEALAEARVEQLRAELKDYLPEQYAVADHAVILRRGQTLALFIAPEAESMAEAFTSAAGQ